MKCFLLQNVGKRDKLQQGPGENNKALVALLIIIVVFKISIYLEILRKNLVRRVKMDELIYAAITSKKEYKSYCYILKRLLF